jgi:hypothetical protein
VTALVVQDRFGGRLLKTRAGEAWHFYNKIDGMACDFKASQFAEAIRHDALPASRSEALEDATMEQADVLARRFSEDYEDGYN